MSVPASAEGWQASLVEGGGQATIRSATPLRVKKERQRAGRSVRCNHDKYKTRRQHIVLQTFYTGRAEISTETSVREIELSKNRATIRTKSVLDQPGGQAKPGKIQATQFGQPLLVQPLESSESLHRTQEKVRAEGSDSMH